tara:strand:+ start:25 stop:435 length:411 start_codon:yes stop_codon:yes gene_type:complete
LRPAGQAQYQQLNSRQQENYNFQKVSAVMGDYGFSTIRLTDDWQGADFIAQHIDGQTFLKIQLKGRLHFGKKYVGKSLHIAFRDGDVWYLLPHDEVLDLVLGATEIANTKSWTEAGAYSWPRLSRQLRALLTPYRI